MKTKRNKRKKTHKHNTTQKTKKMSNTDPIENVAESRCLANRNENQTVNKLCYIITIVIITA